MSRFSLLCVQNGGLGLEPYYDSLNKFVTNFLRKRSKDFRERERERESEREKKDERRQMKSTFTAQNTFVSLNSSSNKSCFCDVRIIKAEKQPLRETSRDVKRTGNSRNERKPISEEE